MQRHLCTLMQRHLCTAILCGIAFSLTPFVSAPGSTLDAAKDASRKTAPNFKVNDSKGAPVRLADFKGKVVLLNFWATWCHGCGEEIPWFIEYQDKYKSQGLVVLGVSMDDEGWKIVTPFIREKKMNYVVVIGDKALGDQFGLAAMPMTVLIDRDGKIVTKHEGVVDRYWKRKTRSPLTKPYSTRQP